MTAIPPGLRTDAPPETGAQILAWAIDLHGAAWGKPSRYPRWMIVQWAQDWPEGPRYWRWSVPGRSTGVKILGWLPLSAMDRFGAFAIGRRWDEETTFEVML